MIQYRVDYPAEACRERLPFLLLLSCLLYLHVIWFFLLLKKGYKELFEGNSQKEEITKKKKTK